MAQVLTWVIDLLAEIDERRGPSHFFSTKEVAELLGVTRKTVQNWCNNGRFPGAEKTSPHGVWRIPAEEVREALGNDSDAEEEVDRLWEPENE